MLELKAWEDIKKCRRTATKANYFTWLQFFCKILHKLFYCLFASIVSTTLSNSNIMLLPFNVSKRILFVSSKTSHVTSIAVFVPAYFVVKAVNSDSGSLRLYIV